jgi:hypothetical protein
LEQLQELTEVVIAGCLCFFGEEEVVDVMTDVMYETTMSGDPFRCRGIPLP